MLPILFVVLVVAALAIYGFGTALGNIRAALGLAWDGAEYALLFAEYEARQFWRRTMMPFLAISFAIFGISILLMAWGVTRDGTYLQKAVPVAIGAITFGCLTAFFALFAEMIERAIEAVIDSLKGIAWAIARLASVFLSIFQVMNRLGPRTPMPRDPMRLRYTEAFFMTPVLLWFWNGAFLTAFPSRKMWGLLVLVNLCFIFGALLARRLRREPWLWRITYAVILPVLFGVMVTRALFPGPIELFGRTSERGYVWTACHMDGATTTDPVCKDMFVREVLEDAEELARKGEKAAAKHASSGAVAIGSTPTTPPPIGFTPGPSPGSGRVEDDPPEP